MGVSRVIPAVDEHQSLSHEVGEALHQFSLLEMKISDLFMVISETADPEIAHAIMAAIQSFKARIQVCARVLDLLKLGSAHRAAWAKLAGCILAENTKRNEIAHFTIVLMNTTDGGSMWRLVPYFSEGYLLRAGATNTPINGLTVDDIKARAAGFQLLANDVTWFINEMQVLKGHIEANPEPTPGFVRQLQSAMGKNPRTKRPRGRARRDKYQLP